jgi:putative flavoprotein involved in K+ transport
MFSGARVAVVGAGNSAIQIAVELTQVADGVTVYTREPIRWQVQRPWGRDLHWWLTRTGLDRTRLLSAIRVVDDGYYRAAFRDGTVCRAPMFTSVTEGYLHAEGYVRAADVIVFATGYRPDLPFLVGTPAVDTAQRPFHHGGISTTVPGLGYVGLERMRSFSSATLRGAGRDARAVIDHLIHH